MLATLVDRPFNDPGWWFEIKWDGYRTLGFCNEGKIELRSRNDKSYNEKFYPIYQALAHWKKNMVVDGEIVVLDKNGKSNFGALQNWRSEADGALYYYVFDLLWLDGKDLMAQTLNERYKLLTGLFQKTNNGIIRLSETYEGNGLVFFESAKKIGLEGIIAKKTDSPYLPGQRSKAWLKIKSNQRQEMVIGGYTKNDDSNKPFSSLLVGVYEKDQLIYTGKIGTGFNNKLQKELLGQFRPLITNEVPFTSLPDINKPSRFRPDPPHAKAVWLKPELVCEVSFAEMTTDGVMRHPSFEGMRNDKKAKEVIREKAKPVAALTKGTKKSILKIEKPSVGGSTTLLNPSEETQVKKIKGHDLKFTHLSKLYWPDDKITKRDMLNYYYQVAPYILPYLKDRPQSLNRHPGGITGEPFYQKDVTGKAPEWIKTYEYHTDGDETDKHFLVATDEASLLYMASLGCIEMNPWSSTINKPEHPTWCIIDLDPDKNTFNQVIEAAQVTYQLLKDVGIIAYPKTSGSSGMHIYIPLGAKYTYEQSKEFARAIATLVHRELPKFTTIERVVKERAGKMYIDFLQNRPQATVAAPYSLRPKPGATVSMPLHWEEVKKGLKTKDFTIYNAMDRIKEVGDLFKPVLGKGVDLNKVIKNLETNFKV